MLVQFKLHILFIVFLLLHFGCSENKQQAQSIDKSLIESTKPKHQAFFVTVNKLRLRNAPGGQSTTIAQIEENDIVYGQGEVSELIDTITLRDQEYISPYYKVSTSKGEGWMYGGGLQIFYEGDDEITFSSSIGNLRKDIEEIPKDRLEVSGWIVDRITNEDMSNSIINDVYFSVACQALDNIPYDSPIYAETEDIELSEHIYDLIFERKYSPSDHPYFKKAYENGFSVDAGEGMIYPVLNRTRFSEMIGGPFTKATKAYNTIIQIEYEKPYMTDAAIYKPLELIAEHINRRFEFKKDHGMNIWSTENKIEIEWMLDYLKYGTSNTPAFDYKSGKVMDEFRISWNNILKIYKDQDWVNALKDWVAEVKANDWINPDSVN